MENLNKILSFILGLIVVAVFILIASKNNNWITQQAEPPCSTFSSYALGDVPVRCINYYFKK